ncbi:YlbF family regulator [Spirochaeta africana]|uniref:YlbF family regulator n=1 Tax=Spirochaeta africana (strain ATCC 700263 / DSM 8902 / Z-7692) TaxID=889378 RepID=H9UFT1_SPIAZ|nr:YlbF family regulator [Spirochaeta africana]AFG36374.1 hypothetical protein Spiaf_0266 [Spirochaeta africana DSM 8902]
MLSIEIREQAAGVAEAIQAAPESQRYIEAQSEYSGDPELIDLRNRYTDLIQDFQRKQTDGSYTQQDIDAVREVQMQVNGHRITQAVIGAQTELQDLLQACNQKMTAVLGMNFAQIARSASASSCGCGGSCDC